MLIDKVIDKVLFVFILSLYLWVDRLGYSWISNISGFILILLILCRIILMKKKFVFNKYLLIYLIFIVICMFSCTYSIDLLCSISEIKMLIYIYIIMLVFVNYIDSYKKIDLLLEFYIYSGVISSIYIILSSDFSNVNRYGDVLGNENYMGLIIGFSVIDSLYMMISKKKYYYLIYIVLMVPVILMTGSRKAIMFIGINLLVMVYSSNRESLYKKIRRIFLIITSGVVLYYLIFDIPFFYNILGQRFANIGDDQSYIIRKSMISFGIEKFLQKPLLGYGVNTYSVLSPYVTYAHNNFIEILVGIGFVGCIIYYLTHIVLLKDLFNNIKVSSDKNIYYMFLGVIISLFFLSYSLVYYDDKYFPIILAISSTLNRIEKIKKG